MPDQYLFSCWRWLSHHCWHRSMIRPNEPKQTHKVNEQSSGTIWNFTIDINEPFSTQIISSYCFAHLLASLMPYAMPNHSSAEFSIRYSIFATRISVPERRFPFIRTTMNGWTASKAALRVEPVKSVIFECFFVCHSRHNHNHRHYHSLGSSNKLFVDVNFQNANLIKWDGSSAESWFPTRPSEDTIFSVRRHIK